ncbi:MAG: hypothetical protein M3198_08750 [Actinomycetota bacterium]|nr:hypothetical protein [Actinomycetota bacterium]
MDEVFPIGSDSSYPVVLGAVDADEDGLEEVFVKVLTHEYHAGATYEVAIFAARSNDIFRIKADGEAFSLAVGGVSTFGEGVECRDVDEDSEPELVLLRVDYVASAIQRWSERIYEWKSRSLELRARREGRFAKTGYEDPLLWRYYSLRCFSLNPPYPYTRG